MNSVGSCFHCLEKLCLPVCASVSCSLFLLSIFFPNVRFLFLFIPPTQTCSFCHSLSLHLSLAHPRLFFFSSLFPSSLSFFLFPAFLLSPFLSFSFLTSFALKFFFFFAFLSSVYVPCSDFKYCLIIYQKLSFLQTIRSQAWSWFNFCNTVAEKDNAIFVTKQKFHLQVDRRLGSKTVCDNETNQTVCQFSSARQRRKRFYWTHKQVDEKRMKARSLLKHISFLKLFVFPRGRAIPSHIVSHLFHAPDTESIKDELVSVIKVFIQQTIPLPRAKLFFFFF